MTESNRTAQARDSAIDFLATSGNAMALSLRDMNTSTRKAYGNGPCGLATTNFEFCEQLNRVFDLYRQPLGNEELERQWNEGFLGVNPLGGHEMPRVHTTGKGWDGVDVVDPVDLLAIAAVARVCAVSKKEMRVAGVAGQEAFGGPLPPPTRQPVGEAFERPVPLHWLLEECIGPVRGIQLRAPGYNPELRASEQGHTNVALPVAELGNMLKLDGLKFLGLSGYALVPPPRLSGQGQLDAKAPPSAAGAAGGAPAAVSLDLSNPELTQFELRNCTGATVLLLGGGELGANGVKLGI